MKLTRRHTERHRTDRIGWLRAAVLGANDGIVSTASLLGGVAAAGPSHHAIRGAGVAGPVLMFALPSVFTGSLEAMLRGVFIDPLTRLGGMNFAMRPLETTLAGLCFATLV